MTALNPVLTVGQQIRESLAEHTDLTAAERRRRAIEMLDLVGIPGAAQRIDEYSYQFSGGMRQRVMIAIALAAHPKLLLADEPTTALDVTIQDQILKLIQRLAADLAMSVILVTHDLGVVAQVCDRVAVMYAGRIVETAMVGDLFAEPRHAYTLGLLHSIPHGDSARQPLQAIPGSPPTSAVGIIGCAFAPRCSFATDLCRTSKIEPIDPRPRPPDLVPPSRPVDRPAQDPVGGRMSVPGEPLLTIRNIDMRFSVKAPLSDRLIGRRRQLAALRGVSLTVNRGETLGLVGESGSGKSTLARVIVRMIEPTAGTIDYDGIDVRALAGADLARYHRRVQMVFQDPYSSLNPRMTVRQMLTEALTVHRLRAGADIERRIAELLDLVRLPLSAADRYPHEFSGGQRQRIGIARALSVEPDCLIADELVSALDMSIQAQIVNLLLELQGRLGLTILFIAHDLRLVRHVSHRVAVMYLGEIVDIGPQAALFTDPRHPYTQGLIAAAPSLDPRGGEAGRRSTVEAIRGELPNPIDLPPGCAFASRCPHAHDRCWTEPPRMHPLGPARAAACHLLDEDGAHPGIANGPGQNPPSTR